jgi:hypothetical protein
MTGQIFISYRRDDASYAAGRLYDHLVARFPIFMDVDTIKPGADFVEAIETSVGSCDVLIAVISSPPMPVFLGVARPRFRANQAAATLHARWADHEVALACFSGKISESTTKPYKPVVALSLQTLPSALVCRGIRGAQIQQ